MPLKFLCAWIFSIIYSTLSAIMQDMTGKNSERKSKRDGRKNISEQRMIGMVDGLRVFSAEGVTEDNSYV